jgi:hypothetical protein
MRAEVEENELAAMNGCMGSRAGAQSFSPIGASAASSQSLVNAWPRQTAGRQWRRQFARRLPTSRLTVHAR